MSNEPEWLTRKTRIDGRLQDVGWDVVPHTPSFRPETAHQKAVTEYPTDNGPADYALFVNGRILGIIEAKKLSLGPQNVLVQAERYSKGANGNPLQFGPYRVPFLFATNGEVIWFHDVRNPLERSRQIAGYLTPSGLEERLGRDFDADCQRLLAPPERSSPASALSNQGERGYRRGDRQTKTENAGRDGDRCGKTFTTVNQAYRLIKTAFPNGFSSLSIVAHWRPRPSGVRLVRAGARPQVRQDL